MTGLLVSARLLEDSWPRPHVLLSRAGTYRHLQALAGTHRHPQALTGTASCSRPQNPHELQCTYNTPSTLLTCKYLMLVRIAMYTSKSRQCLARQPSRSTMKPAVDHGATAQSVSSARCPVPGARCQCSVPTHAIAPQDRRGDRLESQDRNLWRR